MVALSFELFWSLTSIPNSKGNPFSGGVKYTGGKNWRFSTELPVLPIAIKLYVLQHEAFKPCLNTIIITSPLRATAFARWSWKCAVPAPRAVSMSLWHSYSSGYGSALQIRVFGSNMPTTILGWLTKNAPHMRAPGGCKNRPAPFPGRMSYKATKPGSVSHSCLVAGSVAREGRPGRQSGAGGKKMGWNLKKKRNWDNLVDWMTDSRMRRNFARNWTSSLRHSEQERRSEFMLMDLQMLACLTNRNWHDRCLRRWIRSLKRSRHDSSNFMNRITIFASWYHQSFWILNTTAIWRVYLLTLVRKSFNLRSNDCKTSLPDQNDKRILWTMDLLNFYNPTVQPRYFCSKYCHNVTDFFDDWNQRCQLWAQFL